MPKSLFFFLLCTFFSAKSHAVGPDGLCILVMRHEGGVGYGHGFIAGGRLHSSAHVLQYSLHRVLCIQGQRFIDVSASVVGAAQLNSRYRLTDNSQSQVLDTPYDHGSIRLNTELSTVFVIDEFETVIEKVENDKARGIDDDPWFRSFIRINSEILENFPNVPAESIFIRSFDQKLKDDVLVLSVELPDGEAARAEGLVLMNTDDGWQSKKSTVFLDDTLTSLPGYSGSPLFQKLDDGRFLVSGITSSVGPYLDRMRNPMQTLYTLAMNFENRSALEVIRVGNEKVERSCKSLLSN